jgi:hypothetical protein
MAAIARVVAFIQTLFLSTVLRIGYFVCGIMVMSKKSLPWHAICELASKSMIMTKQKKKAETKNQHYVPQFYLRYFSVDKKNVGTYILESEQNIPSAPIKGQASRDYFYSDNMEMEKILSNLESCAKKVLDKIIAAPTEPLSKEDKNTLFDFTVIQLGRTKVPASRVNQWYEERARSLPEVFSKMSTDTGGDQGESLKDLIGEPPPFPAKYSVAAHDQIRDIMRDLSVKILVNKIDKSFITSDNPVAKYNQFMERMGQEAYGLGARGLQIFFPLSPQIGVMYYDPKCYKLGYKKKEYVELDQDKDIDELNKLTSCNSGGLLYYRHGTISCQEFVALSKVWRKIIPKPIEWVVRDLYPGKSILGVRYPSMFCKLSLSFIKELPLYKALQPEDFDRQKHWLRSLAVDYLRALHSGSA